MIFQKKLIDQIYLVPNKTHETVRWKFCTKKGNFWTLKMRMIGKMKRRKVYSAFVDESTHLARFRKILLYLSLNLDS